MSERDLDEESQEFSVGRRSKETEKSYIEVRMKQIIYYIQQSWRVLSAIEIVLCLYFSKSALT